MAKLTKSIKRGNTYAMGGVTAIIAFPTFAANGITPNATLTIDATNTKLVTNIALAAGCVPVSLESELDQANFTDNLTVGTSRYIAQALGFTLAGMDSEKNKAVEDLDLVLHSFAVKTRRGKYFLLGEKNGLIASQNNAGSGSAIGDLDGYQIIVGGAEVGRAKELSEAAWAALTLLVTT